MQGIERPFRNITSTAVRDQIAFILFVVMCALPTSALLHVVVTAAIGPGVVAAR